MKEHFRTKSVDDYEPSGTLELRTGDFAYDQKIRDGSGNLLEHQLSKCIGALVQEGRSMVISAKRVEQEAIEREKKNRERAELANKLRTKSRRDADPEVHSMLANVLDPLVWSVQHAPDNKTELTLASATHFDLILTSEKTSGKEDVDLLRKIRSIRPHTRLIILTEEGTPADVIASMRERAFSYFSRPFSLSSLADMVLTAVEGPCWDDGVEIVSATPDWIRLLARCDLKTADRLMQFIHEIADLPEPESGAVAMAFREILMNAIEHGGHFRPDQYVEISYVRAKHMVMCCVKDPGEGFTLDEIQHAAIANPPDDPARHIAYRDAKGLRPGGYGVLLAQKLVDELIYDEKGNEVLLVKYLDVTPLEH